MYNLTVKRTQNHVRWIIILLFTCCALNECYATHMAGGDIEYTCVGPRKWAIKLTVYRYCDNNAAALCNGFSCPQTITAVPSPSVAQGGLNPNGCTANPGSVSTTLQLQSVEDMGKGNIARCGAPGKNACTNLGSVAPGAYKPSIEKYVFTGELNMNLPSLGTASTCPYWDIGWSYCCRNSTTNIQGQPDFFIQATINIHDRSGTLCSNNSPVMNIEPVAVFCAGQEYIFNMGAIDPDRDSLSYEIVKSLQGFNQPVLYNVPYNERFPFPLVTTAPPHSAFPGLPFVVLDSTSGDLSLNANNPTTQPIAGDLSVRIYQWSYREQPAGSGKMEPFITGITMRNMQLYSIPCLGNTPPKFSTAPAAPNGGPKYNWTVCAGDKICFQVTARDTDFRPTATPPRIDSTFLSWNQGIVRPAGKVTFSPVYDTTQPPRPREDAYEFCWQTEDSDASTLPYYFTVQGEDNFCPNPGRINKAFSIRVDGRPWVSLEKDTPGCGFAKLRLIKMNAQQPFNTAVIEIANQPDDYDFTGGIRTIASADPNPAISGTAIINKEVHFSQPGKYYLRYVINGAVTTCGSTVVYDSVIIPAFVQASINVMVRDTIKCRTGQVSIPVVVSGGTAPYHYRWYRNSTDSIPLNDPFTSDEYLAVDMSNATYYVQVTDSNNCKGWDTMQLDIKRIDPDVIVVNQASQCLEGNAFVFGHQPITQFINYMLSWSSENSAGTDSAFSKTYITAGTKTVRLVISEPGGCRDTAYKNVTVLPSPQPIITGVENVTLNTEYVYGLIHVPGSLYNWTVVNGNFISADTISPVRVKWTTAGQGMLTVKQELNGCAGYDSLTVTISSTGLKELSYIRTSSIIPNPNNGNFALHLEADKAQAVTLKLKNAAGAEFLAGQYQLKKGMNEINLHTDAVPGVYILSISDGNAETIRKVMISK